MLQLYYNEQDANVLQRPTPAFSNLLLLSDHVLWPSGEAETRLYFHHAGLRDHVGIFTQETQNDNLYQEIEILPK
jgi:hypothetical protein